MTKVKYEWHAALHCERCKTACQWEQVHVVNVRGRKMALCRRCHVKELARR